MTIELIFDSWGGIVGAGLIGLPFIIASVYVFFEALFYRML